MKKSFSIGNRQSAIDNGFTLIEVMLVVVIILIAISVAVPNLSGTSDTARMRDAVRSTIRVARYARSMSILNQADCTLTFATNRITLASPDGTLANRRISEQIKFSNFKNLATESDSETAGRTVLFYSSGMNEGFEITLADTAGRETTVTCNPITGKVSTEEE